MKKKKIAELEKLIEANLKHPDRKLTIDYSIGVVDRLKTLQREYVELVGREYEVYVKKRLT